MIHQLLACSLIFAGTPTASEESLQLAGNEALRRGDYQSAASYWETLARRDQLTINRGGVVFAASNAWEMDYEARHLASSVCAGIALLQWYFTATGRYEPEIIGRYWSLAELKQRDGLTCKLRTTHDPGEPKPRVAQVPHPRVVQASNADTPIDREPHAHRWTIAGAVLTSVGAAGLAGMTGALVGYAKRNRELREIGVHGSQAQSVYHQGKLLEHWAIATGVVGGISLVTGVALLSVARSRKLTVRPNLGGLTLQGKF